MRIALGLVLILSIDAFSPVLAGDPPPTPQPAAQTQQAPPPTPQPAAQTQQAPPPSTQAPAATSAKTPVAAAEAVSADGVTKEELKRLHVMGYKQKTRGDQIVYCRVEAVLGTHFDREMCATARDLEFIRANGQEMATQIQRGNFGAPKGAP